ncbi:MAG: selenocysteine-specific translation elongation factor [Microthrixaceae bacterium]
MPTVATAGHVDHGKSTLVRALTGTDPDRLAEERERGLTIDLGFAATTLPSGTTLGFVDVPGHERYLHNMLAGVGAVTTCLFVVAADEGWMPQTEEHLRIIELLGFRGGVVAVTKWDATDEDRRGYTVLEVEDRLRGGPLATAPVLAVDSLSGRGLDELRTALDELCARVPPPEDRGRVRLWIDRVFPVAGAGTVVTGTLGGGSLGVGDVLAAGPGEAAVRVRGLQHHHGAVERLDPGERVAVNLTGVAHHDLRRGHAVVDPGRWHLTTVVDARLRVLASLDHAVSRRGAYTAHLGSGVHTVRLRVLGPDRIEPGDDGAVRLHLPVPVPLLPGDRFVLRESGRDETVGGGEILDVDPVLPAARARPDGSVERVVAERGRVEVDELERLTGRRLDPTVGRWVVDGAELSGTRSRLRDRIEAAGATGVDLAALDGFERALAALDDGAGWVVAGGVVRSADHAAAVALDRHPWVAALRAEPLAGHPPTDVGEEALRDLRRSGTVVRSGDVWFAADALDRLVLELAPELRSRAGDGMAVGDVRAVLGGTRRTLVPFLTWCDEQGITRRRGDVRVAGPRLPSE